MMTSVPSLYHMCRHSKSEESRTFDAKLNCFLISCWVLLVLIKVIKNQNRGVLFRHQEISDYNEMDQ